MGSEWQPIESAPRDGSVVLLYAPGWGGARTGWNFAPDEYWQDCPKGQHIEGRMPTHWMPLPPSPTGAKDNERPD